MHCRVRFGPLTATLRKCWVLASDRVISGEHPDWTADKTIHSIVIESVEVEESHRRQGHFKRLLEELCKNERFDMVVVEGVQNPDLARWLMTQTDDYNTDVMDFYFTRFQQQLFPSEVPHQPLS